MPLGDLNDQNGGDEGVNVVNATPQELFDIFNSIKTDIDIAKAEVDRDRDIVTTALGSFLLKQKDLELKMTEVLANRANLQEAIEKVTLGKLAAEKLFRDANLLLDVDKRDIKNNLSLMNQSLDTMRLAVAEAKLAKEYAISESEVTPGVSSARTYAENAAQTFTKIDNKLTIFEGLTTEVSAYIETLLVTDLEIELLRQEEQILSPWDSGSPDDKIIALLRTIRTDLVPKFLYITSEIEKWYDLAAKAAEEAKQEAERAKGEADVAEAQADRAEAEADKSEASAKESANSATASATSAEESKASAIESEASAETSGASAIVSAAEAVKSEESAVTSAAEAVKSEESAVESEKSAVKSEAEAVKSAESAAESAASVLSCSSYSTEAEKDLWRAQAFKLTADSIANAPKDSRVTLFISNDVYVNDDFRSARHYAETNLEVLNFTVQEVLNSPEFKSLMKSKVDKIQYLEKELAAMLDDYKTAPTEAKALAIVNAGTANIVSLKDLFFGMRAFNQDISGWNVSNVTNMGYMFYDAKAFNQDIGDWDVSNVTNMSRMFYDAEAFNQDISKWDVSNMTNMVSMFGGARAFNGDIGNWNVSNVTNMGYIFYYAKAFNQDIGSWDTSSVTNMYSMFDGASIFNQDISNWDVSNVTSMSNMFRGATAFDQDLESWNVSPDVNTEDMFKDSGMTTLPSWYTE